MADPSLYTYPSPLAGYEDAPPLPDERNADGKSFVNPQSGVLSRSYEEFPGPLDKGRRGGFDIHIYYFQKNPEQKKYARELWERIRRECEVHLSCRLRSLPPSHLMIPNLHGQFLSFASTPFGKGR